VLNGGKSVSGTARPKPQSGESDSRNPGDKATAEYTPLGHSAGEFGGTFLDFRRSNAASLADTFADSAVAGYFSSAGTGHLSVRS
jgi:hypothetical protein